MKIAIWTKSPPKILAIEKAIKEVVYFKDLDFEIISEKASSWISDMPLTMDENMKWAENRAKNLIKEWIEADFYIWMEWGTTIIDNIAYLFGVVYIFDWKEGHFGVSNMLPCPEIIKKWLYEQGKELWPYMDEISGLTEVKNNEWAFALLSDDMLLRSEQFVIAFKSAICPFYNKYYK
jgi:non-canonical (house-cleaning) NTP pyrophosphatase